MALSLLFETKRQNEWIAKCRWNFLLALCKYLLRDIKKKNKAYLSRFIYFSNICLKKKKKRKAHQPTLHLSMSINNKSHVCCLEVRVFFNK